MESEAATVLGTFRPKDLRALAAESGVDIAGCKSKGDLVKRLAASSTLQIKLKTPQFRVRPRLAPLETPDLQTLAARYEVDVAGCETKWDYVNRIAASTAAAARIMENMSKARDTPPAGTTLQAETPAPSPAPAPVEADPIEAPPVGTPAPAPLVKLGEDPADHLILQGRNQDVDFGLVEDIVDQARMRFEERIYDRSLELSREALVLARGTLDAFEKSAWAYALLAAQRLIEESGRVGRDIEPAASLLRDAKVAYSSGNLGANQDLLARLQSATQALYSEDVQRLRQILYATQDRISQTAHIGGDVVAAEEFLGHARETMRRGEHGKSLQLLKEAERLAEEALARRVGHIAAAIPATEAMIEEARVVGADVDEAARLLEQTKVAMERKEFVLAAELVQRAERSSLQSQHHQIQKAMELRMRQIQRGHALVSHLLPIMDEAASYDLSVDEAKELLVEARNVLDQGDYVNGTVLAKRAELILRGLVPRLVEERSRRAITKPQTATCATCGSVDVAFHDDGWSRCNACGAFWRWRGHSSLWERFRSLLRE